MTHAEWQARYTRMREIAERIDRMRTDRARRLCGEAGLDPSLLGIHPHNAMCSFRAGRPWKEVNYSKCRECLRVMNSTHEPYQILDGWDRRVRGIGV